jgi:hypothetical protein
MCKSFADDTTLGDADKDLNTLIKWYVEKLKVLLEWCEFNKLDINLSKTYFMFVINKRFQLPNEKVVGSKIVNSKHEEIKVSVVTRFKILDVTIDNMLTFVEHCSNFKKMQIKKCTISKYFFLMYISQNSYF